MIDRISRNYVHYSAYRQQMTMQKRIHEDYEVRQSYDVANLNGRAHYMEAMSQPRASLETSLIRAAEETNRIHELYQSPSLGVVSPQVDAQGVPYNGHNIDLKA